MLDLFFNLLSGGVVTSLAIDVDLFFEETQNFYLMLLMCKCPCVGRDFETNIDADANGDGNKYHWL